MKLAVIMMVVAMSAPSLLAETAKKTVRDADVVIFDALCSSVPGAEEGRLRVDLRAERESEKFYVSGSFMGPVISLRECEKISRDLDQMAGKTFSSDADVSQRAYTAYEDVWGNCREHPLAGGGWYRCKKGTKAVTRYAQDVEMEIGGISVLNKNY